MLKHLTVQGAAVAGPTPRLRSPVSLDITMYADLPSCAAVARGQAQAVMVGLPCHQIVC